VTSRWTWSRKTCSPTAPPELWLIDTRGEEIQFQILFLKGGDYASMQPEAGGWLRSPRLGLSFRLTRYRTPISTWSYKLEQREG